MRIYKSPIVGEMRIDYSFSGETITATMDGKTDTFDFSTMLDGEVDPREIETILTTCPIASAKRENGVLSVQILNFISEDATEEEKFPKWIEV